jgi:hypothetical protein
MRGACPQPSHGPWPDRSNIPVWWKCWRHMTKDKQTRNQLINNERHILLYVCFIVETTNGKLQFLINKMIYIF